MPLNDPKKRKSRLGTSLCATTMAISMLAYVPAGYGNDDADRSVDRIRTASPIKHVIIIVGENRSFDHLYATYVPKSRGEKVLNLLSEGIINADGSPAPRTDSTAISATRSSMSRSIQAWLRITCATSPTSSRIS
jgi:phospholipase C